MDKYKATNKNPDSIDIEQQKTQEQINTENNANNIKNAAKVAKATKNPYAMAAGYAVEGLDKMTGGKSTELAGKMITRANKTSPIGQQVQNLSNKVSESGVSDKVGQVADAKNSMSGKSSGAANTKINLNSSSTSTSSNGFGFMSDNVFQLKLSPATKIQLIGIGIFVGLILILIFAVVGQKDHQNLAITNHTVFSESSVGSVLCTNEEIDERAVYVGNKRFNDIKDSVVSSKGEYIINSSGGYENFKRNIYPSLETKFSNMKNGVIVFSFDIYDLDNFDLYVQDYKDLISRYSNIVFYVLSFGPISENNTIGVTNSLLLEYNTKIANNFNDIYIDIYNAMLNNYNTIDGITYDDSSNTKLYNYILSSIYNSGKLYCSGGSIESITDSQLFGAGISTLNGESIYSRIGSTKLDEWNSNLINDVKKAGVGNGLAPAIALYDLIQGSLLNNFVIPYFWGGGREIYTGINENWGELRAITLSGNNNQPLSSMHSFGLDGLGLINWAIKNGGCSNYSFKNSNELISLGEKISAFDATPGDIIIKDDFVVMVLRNDAENLIVGEAKKNYGIIFGKYYYSQFENYDVIRMSSYYKNNCN